MGAGDDEVSRGIAEWNCWKICWL